MPGSRSFRQGRLLPSLPFNWHRARRDLAPSSHQSATGRCQAVHPAQRQFAAYDLTVFGSGSRRGSGTALQDVRVAGAIAHEREGCHLTFTSTDFAPCNSLTAFARSLSARSSPNSFA